MFPVVALASTWYSVDGGKVAEPALASAEVATSAENRLKDPDARAPANTNGLPVGMLQNDAAGSDAICVFDPRAQ